MKPLKLLVLAVILLMPLGIHAESTMAIRTWSDLYSFASRVNGGETTLCATLENDIVVNANVLNNEGTMLRDASNPPTREWIPVGKNGAPYTGTFDGKGHVISGLYCGENSVGKLEEQGPALFGHVNGATIRDLGIVDSYVVGYSGKVPASFAFNSTSTKYENCYSTAVVRALASYAAGLVASSNHDDFTCCFFTGYVSVSIGTSAASIANETDGSIYDRCLYRKERTESAFNNTGDGNGITGISMAAFQSGEVAYMLNKGVTDGTQTWYQRLGTDKLPITTKLPDGVVYFGYYDCANSAYTNQAGLYSDEPLDCAGNYNEKGFCPLCGDFQPATYSDSPRGYEITNAGQLYWFARHINSADEVYYYDNNAYLANDIVINENVLNADGDLQGIPTLDWIPIGTESNKFTGDFDGCSHIVSGIYCTGSKGLSGMFGVISSEAWIRNLAIEDSYFTIPEGYDNVYPASFVCKAMNGGTLSYSYSTATVVGCVGAGGLLGEVFKNMTVEYCYFGGLVSSKNDQVGGFSFIFPYLYGNGNKITKCGCRTDGTIFSINRYGDAISYSSYIRQFSLAQMKSGEVAFYLSQGRVNWYGQLLGVDDHPKFFSEKSPQVFNSYINCTQHGYSNQNNSSPLPHTYHRGICMIEFCDNKFEEPAEVDGYFQICNAGNMLWLYHNNIHNDKRLVFTSGVKLKIMNDIDFNDPFLSEDGTPNITAELEKWTPFGDDIIEGNPVAPNIVIEGNGHVIRSMYVVSKWGRAGLFAHTAAAQIRNLGIEDSYFVCEDKNDGYIGAFSATDMGSTFTNCYAFNNTYGAASYAGGMVGKTEAGTVEYLLHSPLFTNCYVSGTYDLAAQAEDVTYANCFPRASLEDVVSGALAWQMNQGSATPNIWRQEIGVDNHPHLMDFYGDRKDDYIVYEVNVCSTSEKGYANTSEDIHTLNNGICDYCYYLEPALLNNAGEYEISNAGNLYWFSAWQYKNQNSPWHVKLTEDIEVFKDPHNLTEQEIAFIEENPWTPIGYGGGIHAFTGVFDGQGHTISGMYSNDIKGFGLFDVAGVPQKGWLEARPATIKNLGIVNSFYNMSSVDVMPSTIEEFEQILKDHGTICNTLGSGVISNSYCIDTKVQGSAASPHWNVYLTVGGICGFAEPLETPLPLGGGVGGGALKNCFSDVWVLNAKSAAIVYCGTAQNCYVASDLHNVKDVYDNNYALTYDPSTLATGEAAYKMNLGITDGSQPWYQKLGVDNLPTAIAEEGNTIYENHIGCLGDATYSNEYMPNSDHFFDENVCVFCGELKMVDGWYEIISKKNLLCFADAVNSKKITSAKAKLLCDIDLTDEEWTPIGSNPDCFFSGEFDGQGHIISGIHFDDVNSEYCGFFGYAKDAKISRLGIEKSSFVANGYVGAICGAAELTTVQNCYSTAVVTAVKNAKGQGGAIVGGLIGSATNKVEMSSCYAAGKVTGNSVFGGLIGKFDSYSSLCDDSYYLDICAPFAMYDTHDGYIASDKGLQVDKFLNGYLTYLLNGRKSDAETVCWFQTLGVDEKPSFPLGESLKESIVYAGYEGCQSDDLVFSNSPEGLNQTPSHNYVLSDTEDRSNHLYTMVCQYCGDKLPNIYVAKLWDGRNNLQLTYKDSKYYAEDVVIPADATCYNLPVDIKVQGKITYKREFRVADGMQSLFLPFQLQRLTAYGKLYKAASTLSLIGGTTLALSMVSKVSANEPCFFMPTVDIDEIVVTASTPTAYITVSKSADFTDDAKNPSRFAFYGTYDQITLPAGAYLYEKDGEGRDLFRKITEPTPLMPFHAYLWYPNASKPESINIQMGNQLTTAPTDIDAAITDIPSDAPVYYNLSGVRISAPRKGEIYIVNGKKYIK